MVGVVRIFDPSGNKNFHNSTFLRLRVVLVGGVVVCLVVKLRPGTLCGERETLYAKVRKPRTETFLRQAYMVIFTISRKTRQFNELILAFSYAATLGFQNHRKMFSKCANIGSVLALTAEWDCRRSSRTDKRDKDRTSAHIAAGAGGTPAVHVHTIRLGGLPWEKGCRPSDR